MKMFLVSLLGGVLVLGGFSGLALADTYSTWDFSLENGTTTVPFQLPVTNANIRIVSMYGPTGEPKVYDIGEDFFWDDENLQFRLHDLPESKITSLVSDLTGKASTGSVSLLNSTVAGNSGDISSLFSSLDTVISWLNGSTTTKLASSTAHGLMSKTDKAKLDALTLPTASSATRSIVTGTGATGFQVSATRPSNVCYSVTIVAGSTLLAPVYGYVALEIAPTNSATAGDWVETGRTGGGDTAGLLHTGTNTGQICGFVPAGYYAKVRSVNSAGTGTYTYNSGQEVLW